MVAHTLLAALTFVVAVTAAPSSKRGPSAPSLSSWHGISSLSGFDNFYGEDNFSSVHNTQTVVVEHSETEVCHSVDVTIIQQQLAVVQEFVKKMITEEICEVETQTIVFSQYLSSISSFSDDLRRHSSKQVGYDSSISGLIGHIHDSNGNVVSNNLGFSGSSVGSHTTVVGGSNWSGSSSPSSVNSAFQAAQAASSASGSSALNGL